ncbi:AI-2E family transporter [Agromyces larvae]|uniref:AI-2E family transporter n=1 Tax=Agromyces larvae TaxID=2929802 RepID=A0ABY4BVP3_9MICO|nr:AI-2E family transporter [Agromyces larvae]UOE43245.1 AI-2E family transporter [Agromyces larvae]
MGNVIGQLAPRPLAHGTRVLVTAAAAVVVFAGIWFAQGILAPAAIGAVITIIAVPVYAPLVRRGWPSWLATTAVVAVGWLILAVLALLLFVASAQFVRMLPDYADQFRIAAGGLRSLLASLGLSEAASDAAGSVLSPDTLVAFATSVADTVLGIATAFFFVFAYVIFMAADAARFARLGVAFGRGEPDRIGRRYFSGVRRYYVVNATFGAIVAVLDGLALWWLGIPIPLVWAILAFVTNFVPNIGFVLGLIPPAVLALVVGGWPLALAVIAVYCVVNVVLQVLVQPKFVSDAVDLSLTLSFFSVVFWAFVIGPVGAILSIPLTLLVRALLIAPEGRGGALWRLSGNAAAGAQDAAKHPDASPPIEGGADVVEPETRT